MYVRMLYATMRWLARKSVDYVVGGGCGCVLQTSASLTVDSRRVPFASFTDTPLAMAGKIESILIVIAMEAEAAPLIAHLALASAPPSDKHLPCHFFTVPSSLYLVLPACSCSNRMECRVYTVERRSRWQRMERVADSAWIMSALSPPH